jgi:arylsulfatase A
VRHGIDGEIELYDLASDIAEEHNIAADHPDVVARIAEQLKHARTDSPHWRVKK